MRYVFFAILIMLVQLLPSDFISTDDEQFVEITNTVTGTDEFSTYVYNEKRFAVLENQNELSFFVLSTDFSQEIGYQGTTTLGIILNKDMTVNRLEIVRSQETAGYIRRLNSMGFPQRFDGFRIGDHVEIITGATMTSEAMIKSVNETIEKFAPIAEKYMSSKRN